MKPIYIYDILNLRRGCALISKSNTTGICDIIIPITFNEDDFSKISVILIKVNKSKESLLRAEDLLHLSSCFFGFDFADNPEIVIYLDLNAPSSNARFKLINELPNYEHIQKAVESRNRRFHYGYACHKGKLIDHAV